MRGIETGERGGYSAQYTCNFGEYGATTVPEKLRYQHQNGSVAWGPAVITSKNLLVMIQETER